MKTLLKDKERKFIDKLGAGIQKQVTVKRMSVLLTVLYLGSLVPLLWIAWYNYPSADDYSIGSEAHQTWVATHSVLSVIWQGILRAAEDWLHWMGYFTSNYLMAVPPNAFGERWYVLTTWIMVGMLSASSFYLLQTIFCKVFHADKYAGRCVCMLLLLASVQCMCPEGRVEAFYWYAGAANYVLVHALSLFFYGLLISAAYDTGRRRTLKLAGASVLGFFVGGGNQMTALNVAIVLLAAIGGIVYRGAGKRVGRLFIPMGLFYFGFLLNVAAPGNWVRAADAAGMGAVKAVLVSFYTCLDLAVSEWTTWPVLVLLIVAIPFFWHMAEKTEFQFPNPLLVCFFGYCLVSAMMTPPFFAVGNIGAGRLQALTYLMYILVLTLCVGYGTGWARKKVEQQITLFSDVKRLPVVGSWCVFCCLVAFLAGSVLMVVPEPHYYTCTSAVADLVNGSAKTYGEEMQQRTKLYNSGSTGVIEVEPLSVHPTLLYFSDIQDEKNYWENLGLSRFYGLDGVVVKK